MIFEKAHDEEIVKAVHKAAESLDYGQVVIKIDKKAPKLEIVIETQEKLRFDKSA